MKLKKHEETILEILKSAKFDKETFKKWRGCSFCYDEEDNVGEIANILHAQYVNMDLENIFAHHSTEEIIDFLNRFLQSKLAYKNGDRNQYNTITLEELEEFKMLAEQTDKISKEELSKTALLLTTETYMELCRVVYDATFEWKYPRDISTAYLFCEARMFSYRHEHDEGILGINWDSPEQFAHSFDASYHNEELYFGGPVLCIRDESARIGENCYTCPEKYGQWTGDIYCNSYSMESVCRAIKMYNALRRKQYPVYFPKYKDAYIKGKKHSHNQE